MAQPFRYQRRVEFRDTDAAGIVHFSVFFNYMEEAECALYRELGMNVVMTDADGSFSFPRVAAHCDYVSPLRFGDVATVDVTLLKLGRSSVTYVFDFSLDGHPVAKGEVTAVCCRLHDDGGQPNSMPIPPDIAAKLAKLVK
jgi:4-hydroxybenzoyl-CoA thioesterase/acyl-CoA thioester hydrolase